MISLEAVISAWLAFATWIPMIEFGGALLIVGYCAAALLTLARSRSLESVRRARLLVAEGAIWGLSFKLAGTLLKTILLHTWQQIALFAVILALRTLLKRIFLWETRKLDRTLREISAPVGNDVSRETLEN